MRILTSFPFANAFGYAGDSDFSKGNSLVRLKAANVSREGKRFTNRAMKLRRFCEDYSRCSLVAQVDLSGLDV
jgi:hypothetical protein